MFGTQCKSMVTSNRVRVRINGNKSMITTKNIILYLLSRHICDRFMAVGSHYDIFSPLQSICMIKSAVWLSFADTIS